MGQKKKGKSQRLELTGRKFGRLEVIKIADTKYFRNWQWVCKCDCGTEKIISARRLVTGNTVSCGCFRKEYLSSKRRILRPYESSYKLLISDNSKRKVKHSVELTYEDYLTFVGKNCHYCNNKIIWNEYRHKLTQNFGYNLDRKDPNQGYTKDNCVACCGICNWMKWKLGYEQFINQVKLIATNMELDGNI